MSSEIVLTPEVYINRELSLLEFQRRVLEEALVADLVADAAAVVVQVGSGDLN
jgi:hypothetical protein